MRRLCRWVKVTSFSKVLVGLEKVALQRAGGKITKRAQLAVRHAFITAVLRMKFDTKSDYVEWAP